MISKKIKIVVWDLDATFWKGTLSEGAIQVIPENVNLVKRLTDCGIVIASVPRMIMSRHAIS